MSTGSDIADEYISDLNFGAAELLRSEIDAAISAAVQAEHQRGDQRVLDEREACAKVAIETSGDQATRARIATAIRARNESK